MDDITNPPEVNFLVPPETIDDFYENLPADCPNPTDFEKFLVWASKAYCVEYEIIITRTVQESYVTAQQRTPIKKRGVKTKSMKTVSTITDFDSNNDRESSIVDRSDSHAFRNIVNIETVYDSNENLVKLKFLKNKIIPRIVMNVIAITVPYQTHLTSITINHGLRMDTLYEISIILPNSQITELCFDGTFLEKANYHILLTQNKLKHLSLARCTLNDAVVKKIADELIYPSPAAKILSALNLSCNQITDVGAKHLANMLRTNRQLSYLNLTGNMITDEGGVCILETLQKFPVESQELIQSRVRYVAHIKERNALINKFIIELQTAAADKNTTKKKTLRKCKLAVSQSINYSDSVFSGQNLQDKAEFMADRILGVSNEPFSPNNIEVKDGVVYCLGNNTLYYLNLAYNNLSYVILKKLLEVLTMQKHLNRIPRGLIKVVIEGNLMPIACEEYRKIDNLLETVTNKQHHIKKKN